MTGLIAGTKHSRLRPHAIWIACALAPAVAAATLGAPDAWAQESPLRLLETAQAPEGQEHSIYHDYAVRSEFVRAAAPSASTESVRFEALGQDLTLSSETAAVKNGILAWEGTDDSGSVAVLIVDGTRVLGTIETAGATYAIAAVPGDLHEVLELDPALFPPLLGPDAAGVAGASSGINRAQISQLESAYLGWVDYDGTSSRSGTATTVTIKVMVASSRAADNNAEPSTSSLVRMIEVKANRVYKANDLPIRIDAVHDGITGYSEEKNVEKDLDKLVNPSDTATRRIHVLAERNDADLVILMVHNSPGSDDASGCGMAQETLAKRTSTAFAVVHHACVLNHHATAAIGVLQGAGFEDLTNSEFSYAKAYSAGTGAPLRNYATVMVPGGAHCSSNSISAQQACTRKEMWSDPYRNFFGTVAPAGTVERWNAKAVFATAPHVASLRGAAQSYDSVPPTGAITLPSTIPPTGSMQIRATFSEPIHDAFPPDLTVTDGTRSTTATMKKASDTVYTYSHRLDGETGTVSLLFSNARDAFGNPVSKTPTAGATFAAAALDVADPSPASGSVTSIGDSFSQLVSWWSLSGDGNWAVRGTSEENVPGERIATNRVLSSVACDDSCIAKLNTKLNTVEPLTIEFDRYIDRKIDSREGLFVEYSTDGSRWTELASYTGAKGDDTSRWEREVVGLSIPQGSAEIRFHAKSDRSGETVEIDNLSIYRPTAALPDVAFTARLNDARSSISLSLTKATSHLFSSSDFTVSSGSVSSVTNSANSHARSIAVSGVPYGTAVTVTYAGQSVDLGGGAVLHNGTSAVAPPVQRPDRAPSVSAVPSISVAQGATASRQVTASDPDGDAISLSISGNPSFVSLADLGGGRGTVTASPPATAAAGSHAVSVTATAGSLSASTSFTVTVTRAPDTTPPAVTAPPDVTAEATGARTAVSIGTARAVDARDGAVAATSDAPAAFPLGATTVTWTARDSAGNSATATQTVTVRDTTAPRVAAPADATLEATARLTPLGAAQYGTATAADIADPSPAITSDAPAAFPLGETTIIWTATDGSGNSATATQTVTVRDTTAPIFGALAGVTAEAAGALTVVALGAATAADAVDGDVSAASDAPASFPLGATVVTWTAADSAGNSATATQTVTVLDTTAPAITAPPDATAEATGLLTLVSLGTATATDAVDGAVSAASDAPAAFPLGETAVVWTAADSAGNSATATQTVTVLDTTAPSIVAPGDLTVEATDRRTPVVLGTATATDAVDSSVDVTNDAPYSWDRTYALPPGDAEVDEPAVLTLGTDGQPVPAHPDADRDAPPGFPLGATTVTWTATDDSGNSATATQTVTVTDTTPPRVAAPFEAVLEAAGALTPFGPTDYGEADATDNSGESVSVSSSAPELFPLGLTVIVYSATDSSGNAGADAQSVWVGDTTPPEIAVPEARTFEATGPLTELDSSDYGAPTITDAFGFSASDDAPSLFPLGATIITHSATDVHANSAAAEQTVVLADTTPPEIAVPDTAYTVVYSASDAVEFGVPPAADLVDGAVAASCDPPPGARLGLGATTVACTASDGAGNSSTVRFEVAVSLAYGEPPVIVPPPDATFEATGILTPLSSVDYGSATATDGAGGAVPVSSDAPAAFPLGATVITYTATNAGGLGTGATQEITVRDTTPPSIRVLTPDRFETAGPLTRADLFTGMQARDPMGIREVGIKPELVPLGTTVMYYSATDTNGNGSTVSKPVTLVKTRTDTVAPAFPAPPDIVVRPFSSTATVTYSTMTVWDDYDPSPTVSCDPPSGSAFQEGITKVECSVSDNVGNVRLRHFYVLVEASGATRSSVHENRFDGGLGGAVHKETVWNENGRVCGPLASSTSSDTSVYSLSHSREAGGSAHLRYAEECWSGHTGMSSEISVAPGTATSTLIASFDYRGLADLEGYRHINHVNNMHFAISDSQGRLLDLGKPLTGREPGYLSDTGWRSVTAVVPGVGPALCPCELYVYTGDFWFTIWKKQLYLDNVVVQTVPAAPPGPSGASGAAAAGPPNLLTVGELLAMQAYDEPRVVIVEKRAHDDSVLVSWDHDDWAREYEVSIRPASDPSAGFTDTASGGADRYRFVNLSPGTEYVVSVGELGDDSTQASVRIKTPEAGTHPFDPGLRVSAWQDGGSARIAWTDHGEEGDGRYRVERSVGGGPFVEIEGQPGAGTEASEAVKPEWHGEQVAYRVFEWYGKQKLYSDEASFAPRP